MTEEEKPKTVSKVNTKSKAKVKPVRKLTASEMKSRVKVAMATAPMLGGGGNFYSPELSTDFLELPQSLDEQRNFYRFFYRTDPFVGQAIDLHTELPLSKIRLGMPVAKNKEIARKALSFCEKWAKRVGLLHRLIEIIHEYNLLGEVFVFCEDNNPDMPKEVTHYRVTKTKKKGADEKKTEEPKIEIKKVDKPKEETKKPNKEEAKKPNKEETKKPNKEETKKPNKEEDDEIKMTPDEVEEEEKEEEWEEVEEYWKEKENAHEEAYAWLKKNYKGWTAVRILPPEQVHMESFPFTDEKIIELIPDSKTRDVVERASLDDPNALRIAQSMPPDVVEAIREGRNIPLNTDPELGSFVFFMARKKSQYEPRGHSVLERCLRILIFRDKLRQAQTSIASRHMTPIRLVYAEDMDAMDVEALRDQVDLALSDPDYSIISNFQVNWEEMGADSRLLDLSSEYDMTDRQMYAGLGVTESLLSGESAYSGDRIHLEVINTRYMLMREVLQEMVEENMLKPMCKRMGFIEEDDDGEERVVHPTLTFTRLGLRDNQDTFDALFNLYQKGSLDVGVILELLNIDPELTKAKLAQDAFTLNDSTFNEVLRGIYSAAGNSLAENSDAVEKIAKHLGLKYAKPAGDGGGGRF
jgi:flagellar biosynthesis GTPase FlhF